MLLTDKWDWDEALAVRYKEGVEKGIERGKKRGIAIGEARGEARGVSIGREDGIAIGHEEVFALLERGVSLAEAKRMLAAAPTLTRACQG